MLKIFRICCIFSLHHKHKHLTTVVFGDHLADTSHTRITDYICTSKKLARNSIPPYYEPVLAPKPRGPYTQLVGNVFCPCPATTWQGSGGPDRGLVHQVTNSYI